MEAEAAAVQCALANLAIIFTAVRKRAWHSEPRSLRGSREVVRDRWQANAPCRCLGSGNQVWKAMLPSAGARGAPEASTHSGLLKAIVMKRGRPEGTVSRVAAPAL